MALWPDNIILLKLVHAAIIIILEVRLQLSPTTYVTCPTVKSSSKRISMTNGNLNQSTR